MNLDGIMLMSKEIKQDINFLQRPLWFQNPKHDGLGFVWKDKTGYEYRTGYKPPDKVDIIILLYLLVKSQSDGFSSLVNTTRREILKSCSLPCRDNRYYARIEDSLKRWKNVAIEFNGCFYKAGEHITIGFGIIDDYIIDKKNKKVIVHLNKNWLLQIKNTQYFKRINFEYYKALKRPVSRRLHEILCKNFMGRNKWPIRLTKLGENLTLQGRKKKLGEKVIYASDVLVAIKPAINEINKLSSNIDIIKKTDMKSENVFTVSYRIVGDKQERVIIFERHLVIAEKEGIIESEKRKLISIEKLFKIVRGKVSKKLNVLINNYYESHGFEHVKWNLLYANKHAKKNYLYYVEKALEKNWAEDWAEEEKKEIEIKLRKDELKQKELEEAEKKEKLEKLFEKQRENFCQEIDELKEDIKIKLWKESEKEIPHDIFRREFNVKIKYAELLLKYFNNNGSEYVDEVISDLPLVAKISQDISV